MAIDVKTFKVAYIVVAFVVMLLAIVAALFHETYIALGFIVLASIIILCGSLVMSQMYKADSIRKFKKRGS